LRKLKPPKDDEFGSTGGEAYYLSKRCRLLAKMEPGDQKLLLHIAQKVARDLAPKPPNPQPCLPVVATSSKDFAQPVQQSTYISLPIRRPYDVKMARSEHLGKRSVL
jgi:hypothetical protein